MLCLLQAREQQLPRWQAVDVVSAVRLVLPAGVRWRLSRHGVVARDQQLLHQAKVRHLLLLLQLSVHTTPKDKYDKKIGVETETAARLNYGRPLILHL